MSSVFVLGMLSLAAVPVSAQTWKIVTEPGTATVFRSPVVNQGDALIQLGVGTGEFKVRDHDPNLMIVRADGYREERHTFLKDEKQPKDKTYTVIFTRRVVAVSALPYDAAILVNGEDRGKRSVEVDVEQGQTATVELKKPGFATVRRTYRFERGTELPPVSDRLELTDRLVVVSTAPGGGSILRDGTKIGDGTVDVVIPRSACVVVRAEKPGSIPTQDKQYCNKDGSNAPPIQDVLLLSGRVVNVSAPAAAHIFVNEQQAGMGTYGVKVADKTCVNVRIEQVGFIAQRRVYCSHPEDANSAVPPIDDPVLLKVDESFSAAVSMQTDQANNNITLEVGMGRDEATAWKLLSSMVLSYFDVLENSDRDTGYLRTAWQPKFFADGTVLIRTRIIVKRSSTDPLRYTVKINSERADGASRSDDSLASRGTGASRVSVKDDEKFAPWERLLNTYKEVISEMQSRLR